MAPSLPSPCACVPHFSPHMESCPATLLPSLGAGSAPHFYRHWEWSLAPHFYPHVCVCVCVPPLEVGAPPLLSPWSLTPHLYLHESATHFNPRVDSRPSLLSPLGGGGCPSLLSPCGVCAPYGIAPLTHTSWNMRAPHTCLLNPTSIAIWIVPLTSLYTKDGGQNVTWCLHGYLVKLRIMLRS